jgi:GntR family transcriptional regulator
MKIWIAKNSEVPVREQLITQIALGIAAGDLAVGEKLPSTREIARRCGLHSNTVSSAYQKLVDQSLLEFRKGSGFYVAESASGQIEGTRKIERLIDELFDTARALGIEEKQLVTRIRRRASSKPGKGIVVIEPDAGLREILVHELSAHFPGVRGVTLEDLSDGEASNFIVAAMYDEKPRLEGTLRDSQRRVYLRGRSVSTAMSGESRPGVDEIVSVLSGWDGFLSFARIMLLAANLPPGNIIVRSTKEENWKQSVRGASIIICDSVTALALGDTDRVRPFRIVSDESVHELAGMISAV